MGLPVGVVLLTAVLCGSVAGSGVGGVDTTEDGYLQAETNYTMAVDLDEDNCFGNFSDCLNRNRDWDNLKPFTETPEGRVAFDDDFFSRICQYSSDLSDCIGEMEPSCHSQFPRTFTRFKTVSPILCRHKEALATLVSCMNEKEFQEAFQLVAQYQDPQSDECGAVRDKLSRALLIVKDRCDARGYANLIAVLRELGEDVIVIADSTLNLKTALSCTIDIDALIRNKTKRSWFQPLVGA
ncbi:uncharacterized protein LOC125658807 [Ostrea edulis]|uniref:uncharacterized protein LOC125658807 n=1 Tax=Ostrea edulis TaxID=37623 RepID=UPI0024AEE347|nr:uncharacterized protein LOC125658807 [Ostrea edulis]